jgi:ankyrin repeat protein
MVVAGPVAAQFKSDGYAFLEAVKDREGDVATKMLKRPGSVVVNTRDTTTGESALHIVTKSQDSLWIKFLAQNGANPNIRDKKGIAPLQIAATLGCIECVEALLKAGAHVDDQDAAGETALISAVHNRNSGLVRLLLKKGANPDRNDNSGRSAREYAALQIGNSQLLLEFRRADDERAGKVEEKSYGPTF